MWHAMTMTIHPTYARLLVAARNLRSWQKPEEIARGLTSLGYPLTSQTMTNWRTRGVSAEALVRIPPLIGCSAEWLAHGTGLVESTACIRDAAPGNYSSAAEQTLLATYRRAARRDKTLIEKILRAFSEESE